MECENGVSTENDKHVVTERVNLEGSDVDGKREEEILSKNEQSCKHGVNENPEKDNETLNECGAEGELCGTVKGKLSIDGKVYNGGTNRSNKSVKDKPNVRGSIAFGRGMTRPSLSQSLSFPAKGLPSDAMRKSIEVYPVKSDARQSRKTWEKGESIGLKDKVSLTSRTSTASKEGKNVMNSKGENKDESEAAARRKTLPSLPSFKKSMSGKSLSAKESSNNTQTEVLKLKSPVPLRADEDAHSTASSSATPRCQRRNSAPGFSSRLEERAEKRKEFFSKIEEKIHAREAEKNNLQAKSKESQEAEIKQLRKTLTFKATPMPNFYKEPPPKVELKKIPTTRPISPKLGRRKISTSASNHSSEALSPRVIKDQGKSPRAAKSDKSSATSVKPIKSAQPKPLARDSLDSKKVKAAEVKSQDENACAEKSIECPHIDMKPTEHSVEGNGPTLAPSNPENLPPQVSVES